MAVSVSLTWIWVRHLACRICKCERNHVDWDLWIKSLEFHEERPTSLDRQHTHACVKVSLRVRETSECVSCVVVVSQDRKARIKSSFSLPRNAKIKQGVQQISEKGLLGEWRNSMQCEDSTAYIHLCLTHKNGPILALMAFSHLGIPKTVPKPSIQVKSIHSSSPLGPSCLKKDQAFKGCVSVKSSYCMKIFQYFLNTYTSGNYYPQRVLVILTAIIAVNTYCALMMYRRDTLLCTWQVLTHFIHKTPLYGR